MICVTMTTSVKSGAHGCYYGEEEFDSYDVKILYCKPRANFNLVFIISILI